MNALECREKLRSYFAAGWAGTAVERIASIQGLRTKCGGTPAYFLAISNAYLAAGEFRQAQAFAREGMSIPGDEFHDGLARVEFAADISLGERDAAYALAKEVLERDETSPMGHLLLAKFKLLAGQFEGSIDSANRAIQLGAGPEATTVLITAQYNANRFDKAAGGFEEKLAADHSYIQDVDAVLAAVGSYIELGNTDRARLILDMHLSKVPSSREHPTVIRAISLLSRH